MDIPLPAKVELLGLAVGATLVVIGFFALLLS